MAYKGIIKKSRTYDSIALSQAVDVALPIWMAYSPEQIGISLPIYIAVRFLLNYLQTRLRASTTGPVGVK